MSLDPQAIVIDLLCGFLISVGYVRWRYAIRLYRKFPWSESWRILLQSAASGPKRYLYILILATGVKVHEYLTGTEADPNFPLPQFAFFQIAMWVTFLTPPTVLYLAASHLHTISLKLLFNQPLWRYRVAALLHRKAADNSFINRTLEPDNFYRPFRLGLRRKGKDALWHARVIRLLGVVPVVALDTRISSPGIVWEIQHIVDVPAYLQKTIFIVAPNGDAPALEEAGVSADIGEDKRVRVNTLIPFLKKLLRELAAGEKVPVSVKNAGGAA